LAEIRKKGERPSKNYRTLMKITPSYSAYQKTLPQRFQAPIDKNVEFAFFARRKITDALFVSFVVFFQG
jgi:hypothetical protein